MAINRINTGESFKFLTNQSSILHTVDINKITVNGVNVIVDKPKRGDIMCITKDQKVIWIDGLSIEPTQLSQEFEPVGICLVVKGNKAHVRYKEEKRFRWAASERWELPNSSIMNDGVGHTCTITLNGVVNPKRFLFMASSRAEFVDQLNTWFVENDPDYSAELVELNTDLPATNTSDTKDGDSYRNRIIVNALFTGDSWKTINIEGIGAGTRAIAKHIKAVRWYYKNNGFKVGSKGGCCRAKYYDYYSNSGQNPSEVMTSINSNLPVSLTAFTSNTNCQLLRDNFATYDDYLDSWMAKFPCGAGGTIAELLSGKENTYKLADCTFLDNTKDVPKQEFLYPAANWAASIDLNAPKLGKGNWWLPSSAEMVEIMRDITYGTSFWKNKPDIINNVLKKLNPEESSNSTWSMLSASKYRWTSSGFDKYNVYNYDGGGGNLNTYSFYYIFWAVPITIYEF